MDIISISRDRWARAPTAGRSTRHCEDPGCKKATKKDKPYCTDHVKEHDYAQHLLGIIEGRDKELEKVRQQGRLAVDPKGLQAQEILMFLRVHGERTVPRLARDLNLKLPDLKPYIRALKDLGSVELGENKRGVDTVKISSNGTSPPNASSG